MEQKEKIRAQKSMLARMQVVHFGQIAFNLEIVVFVFCLFCAFSFTLTLLYYMFLIIVSFGTIGIIYLIAPDFASTWDGGEALIDITSKLFESLPYVLPVGIVFSLLSIICLKFDQNKKHTGKIVCSIILMIIAIAYLIFILFIKEGDNA